MNDILLSIVIPAYNSERFLPDLISNLLNQIKEFGEDLIEILIVNDGSVDSTPDIVNSFIKIYPFIFLVNQENRGECGARNTGIIKARGRYIYFLDSDDSIPEGTLSFFKSILLNNELLDMIAFGYVVEKNGIVTKTVFSDSLDENYLSSEKIKRLFFSKLIPCCICSLIFSRNFIIQNNLIFPQGVKIGGDMSFMVNAFTKAASLYYSKRISFIYKIREDSVMQGYKGYNIDRIRSFEVVRDTIINNAESYSLFKKETNFFIANLYLANLAAYLKSNVKDAEINKIFIQNKFFLYKSLKGKFLNRLGIYITRCIPIRLLFKFLKY